VHVCPLAADSLGVRSMATYVECGPTRLLIDPGATLAESRFALPPSRAEREALGRATDRIAGFAVRATHVFVSHYHEDHFSRNPDLYAGRVVWAKDLGRMINPRQQARGRELWAALAPRGRPESADGRRWEEEECALRVSPALSHGAEGSALGWVVALTVEDRRDRSRFVFAGDVQGPLSAVATAYLVRERPTLLYLAGPPAYLERQLGTALIDRGVDNLLRIIDATGCRVIMDHYALRDRDYEERFRRLWETGRVATAAGFLGVPESPLESRRPRLWAAERKGPVRMPFGLKAEEGPGKMTRRAWGAQGHAPTHRRKEGNAE
jgi:hypothetical protein